MSRSTCPCLVGHEDFTGRQAARGTRQRVDIGQESAGFPTEWSGREPTAVHSLTLGRHPHDGPVFSFSCVHCVPWFHPGLLPLKPVYPGMSPLGTVPEREKIVRKPDVQEGPSHSLVSHLESWVAPSGLPRKAMWQKALNLLSGVGSLTWTWRSSGRLRLGRLWKR